MSNQLPINALSVLADQGQQSYNTGVLANLFPEAILECPNSAEEFCATVAPLTNWRDRLALSQRRGIGFGAPGGGFTRAFYEAITLGDLAWIAPLFSDQIVVELGAGWLPYGAALAELSGALGYIGVDPYFADYLNHTVGNGSALSLSGSRFPFRVVAKDMLSFLREVPDQSVSVFTCGIEACILPHHDYARQVEREIARVLHPEGCFAASQSDLGIRDHSCTSFRFRRWDSGRIQHGAVYTRSSHLLAQKKRETSVVYNSSTTNGILKGACRTL